MASQSSPALPALGGYTVALGELEGSTDEPELPLRFSCRWHGGHGDHTAF